MRSISITADDVGALEAIDKAVDKLIQFNVINSVSVIVNGDVDKSWLQKYIGKIRMGLHLTYSFGRPISPVCDSNLVDYAGNFLAPQKPLNPSNETISASVDSFLKGFGKSDPGQLRAECYAQINKFIELFSFAPAFINLHHDLDRCNIVRNMFKENFPEYNTRMMKQCDSSMAYEYIYQFVDSRKSIEESEQMIIDLINRGYSTWKVRPSSEIEIVFHPAFFAPQLESFSTYSKGRLIEYQILSTPKIQNLISMLP